MKITQVLLVSGTGLSVHGGCEYQIYYGDMRPYFETNNKQTAHDLCCLLVWIESCRA